MKTLESNSLVEAHEQNRLEQLEIADRIPLYIPANVHDALTKLELHLENYSASKSSLLRTVVPEWGGPTPKSTKHHVPPEAMEFLKKVPFSELGNASQLQERHFIAQNLSSSHCRRHRYYLKQIVDACIDRGWLIPKKEDDEEPKFNQLKAQPGQRRITCRDVRTTQKRHPKTYGFGKLSHHFVEIDGKKVLGNLELERQLDDFKTYTNPL